MAQSLRTENKRTVGILNNNILDKKLNTDEKMRMRSNVDLRPKL